MKKLSLQMRLTGMSVFLLSICCIGLTFILNFNANNMADVIEATVVLPAVEVGCEESFSALSAGGAELSPSVESQQARTVFFQTSIAYMLLVIAAGGGITWFMVGRALKPLKALSSRMKSCTANNLSQQIPVPQSRGEVAELTESFNQMSSKLDQAFAMQRRFAQSAAHELRTPLTVLRTKVDVFRKHAEHDQQDYDKLIEGVLVQTRRLSDLVQELLELTNLDGVTERERVPVYELLKQVTKELSPLAETKQVNVFLKGSEEYTVGNRLLLGRVFFNLVENAIKYNRPNGSVCITLSPGPVVSISDTGIGIPEEALELIFEPFYRVDKSRSRQMGGAGLGLATAKAIVEQHGGTIEASLIPEGGSCFTVHLP